MATKSAPITSESGFSQLVTGSPVALPTGTRPDATAPTTVPMKNGVSSDESPNSRSASSAALEPPRGLVEREPRAAQHDAERGQAERDEERREDRLERRREPRPEDDEHEDQPDVVGLPDRADRPVDQLARAPAALAARRRPGSRSRRRSPRRRTPRRPSRPSTAPRRRRRRCSRRRPRSAAAGAGRARRARRSPRSSAARQRRDIARSVDDERRARARRRASTTTANVTQTPSACVTASSVRMTL